jgi:hypothetical protein
MSDIQDKIRRYIEPTLGKVKSRYFQLSVNCPKCDAGNKFNLEININPNSEKYLLYKCWACAYSGFIRSLLEEYAVDPSWKVLPEFKSSYQPDHQKKETPKVLFPEHTIPYYLNKPVEQYLIEERKMNPMDLYERNVRYCFSPSDPFYNHILFPFYDHQGTLLSFCAQNFETKKYKNVGSLSFVAYEQFINPLFPIVITEGIYDAGSVVNAIPLRGTSINQSLYRYCQDKKIILALDNDKEVSVETKKQYIKKLYVYGAKIVVIFELGDYKDLNDFWCKDPVELKSRMKVMFELLNNS